MNDDRLKEHREACKRKDGGVFSNWLSANCTQAKPISEVRKIMDDIKAPIREELRDDES
jgi:hypothetical protein